MICHCDRFPFPHQRTEACEGPVCANCGSRDSVAWNPDFGYMCQECADEADIEDEL